MAFDTTMITARSENIAVSSANRLEDSPLTDYECTERKRLEPEIKRATNKRKTLEARIEWLRKQAAAKGADTTLLQQIQETEEGLPDIPRVPQLWTQDVTPEKLTAL